MRQLHKRLSLPVLLATALLIGALVFTTRSKAFYESDSSYQLAEGRLITHALQAVSQNYLEPDLIEPADMLEGAIEAMERLIPEFLVSYDGSRPVAVTVGIATKKLRVDKVSSLSKLRQAMVNILSFVDLNYVGNIEKPDIEYAALEGMLNKLDPHSSFLPPKVYKEFRIGTKGTFGGLGIVISIKDGDLIVISPLEGTPAWRAGMKAGDKIVQIGDESTINMSLTDAVNKLRGKVGTKVRIVISRPGTSSPFSVTLTRAVINIDSVQSTTLAANGKKIGYVKVKSFQSNTDDDFMKALAAFHKEGKIDGLILDLRNNPGGLLNQAIDLVDHFLSSGTIVTTVASHNVLMDKEDANPYDLQPDYPMIILINEGSASASEIVAGALMAHDRAVIMGHRSFGKGSVQTLFEIGQDSAVKLTIAKYLPAGTMSIQSVGITPDIELIPKTVDRKQMDLVEDEVPSEADLEKHLEKTGETLGKSEYRIGYYKPFEDTKDDTALRMREYSKVPDVAEDFAVQLAKKLLASVVSSTRKNILKEIKKPLLTAEEEQNKIIFRKLAALGIDWSTIPKEKKSQLQVKYNLMRSGIPIKTAQAGTEIQLELVATNIGKGEFGRLLAVGQSESPLLKNKEFVFGKLIPGQTRSWQIPLEIPESMPAQDLIMELSFHEENGNIPTSLNTIIPIESKLPPRFAFKYNLSKAGSSYRMTVTAYNVGKGTSSAESVMTLANKSGTKIFIERGRTVLGTLAPGASGSTTFRFRTMRDFNDPQMKFDLNIVDPKRLVLLSKEISIDPKDGAITPKAGSRYEPPSIVLHNPARTTDEDFYELKGLIHDNDAVKDFYIFVGNKKVAYYANPKATNEMKIYTRLPLEDGPNAVNIAARDEFDLTERAIFVIQRAEDENQK